MIDTEEASARLRALSVDTPGRRLLVSRLAGSDQEPDISAPVNCDGLGRIRHFGRATPAPWPANPLPGAPAARHLHRTPGGPAATDEPLRAQVFQNAACNWRCWYCYVPFNLLGAHGATSRWVTAGDLVNLWRAEPDPPAVLDLSGGQPDLVPEWVPWTMRAILDRGLADDTYLWSDDNLSTDYLWRFLGDDDLQLMADYPGYGRAVCFKGVDADSFTLNTAADPQGWDVQFDLARRLLDLGIDVHCYATFPTTAETHRIPGLMAGFVDRLQDLRDDLPLHTVPLRVDVFGPVHARLRPDHLVAMQRQETAVEAWNLEIAARFPAGTKTAG